MSKDTKDSEELQPKSSKNPKNKFTETPDSEEITKEKTPLAHMEEIAQNEKDDFSRFMQIQAVVGNVEENKMPTQEQAKDLITKYEIWKAAGKPAPVMPQSVTTQKIPVPSNLYRAKHLGEQYLYWIDTDGNYHDYEEIPVYGKKTDKDPNSPTFNQDIEDRERIISHAPKYLKKYTHKDGIDLVDRATKLNINPFFTFVTATGKFSVGIQDFNAPHHKGDKTFDDIVGEQIQKRYVPK